MIELGEKEGVLKHGDGHLLPDVIKFRETVAKECMVPRTEICSFEVSASFQQILAGVIKEGHTRWPVYETNIDNIIGIFHVKDLLQHMNECDDNFSLTNFLRPVKFVHDMMKIGHLLKEFQGGKAHLAIVVDEYGGTAGIISLEDVLEEIVGEIRDEYDDEECERTIKQIDSNNYIASGKAKIFEVGKALNVSFPDSDAFDSLGGFLVAIQGCMPHVGTKIIFGSCTFLIKTADEKKIIDVHIHQSKQASLSGG
jgi:CBS domain containing-hemolysin-like protein